jgi:hypothetical protein
MTAHHSLIRSRTFAGGLFAAVREEAIDGFARAGKMLADLGLNVRQHSPYWAETKFSVLDPCDHETAIVERDQFIALIQPPPIFGIR